MSQYFPRQNGGITEQKLGDETIVYTSESESIHVLNKTAAFIWKLCDGLHSIEMIQEKIHKEYEIKPGSNTAKDIRKILDDFTAKGLIQS